MDKINLSKLDKIALMHTYEDSMNKDCMPIDALRPTLKHLEALGLVEIQNYSGQFHTARLTDLGKKYKLENPKLKNNISENTKWLITNAVSVLALIIAIIALFC